MAKDDQSKGADVIADLFLTFQKAIMLAVTLTMLTK